MTAPQFQNRDNYSLITAFVYKEHSNVVVKKAMDAGASIGSLTQARGTIKRSKIGFLPRPNISPSRDILQFIVKKDSAEKVFNTIVSTAKLEYSGAGAAFIADIDNLWFIGDAIIEKDSDEKSSGQIQSELTSDLELIACISQRGKADDIVEASISQGSSGPVVTYGYGRGVRDKLGLLRIAINPEKEIVFVVVTKYELDSIFEAMISAGKLDRPAMGFIYHIPIRKGLINITSFQSGQYWAATREQMIKAIDELKGNQLWRQVSTSTNAFHIRNRTYLEQLVNIRAIVRRDLGDQYILKVMEAGASGATVSFGYLIGGEKVTSILGRNIADEREIIDIIIPENKVTDVVESLKEVTIEVESKNAFFYSLPVPKAFTYLGS